MLLAPARKEGHRNPIGVTAGGTIAAVHLLFTFSDVLPAWESASFGQGYNRDRDRRGCRASGPL